MSTITLNSYNSTTGCLYFTIVATGPIAAVTVQKSTDNGVTWIGSTGGATSPRCGFTVSVPTLFRLRLENEGVLSNIISSDNQIIRTPIDEPNKIYFANSPVHLRLQNAAGDSTIQKAKVKLWIWNGQQNKILGLPSVNLQKNKISSTDNYINFEISDYLKAYLLNPEFGYNVNEFPAVSGQGVFWQIQSEIDGVVFDYPTKFATLGWLWNYEQNGLLNNYIVNHGSFGFEVEPVKWYNTNVPIYFKQGFVFGQSITECTSANMILMSEDIKTRIRCSRESCLIAYLDKRGLWDVFTPHGKIEVNNKVESVKYERGFRDPSKVNNSVSHSQNRDITAVSQTYTINTGSIDESNVQNVEELIYSPKVYLIRFSGKTVTEIQEGITIDSTFVTIDDSTITIDSAPTIPTQVPYFSEFQQIPVIIDDSDFVRKTLLNDKTKIDYQIKLTEANNKINNTK